MTYASLQAIRELAGFQYKERGETLSPATGDGSNKIFYSVNKSIVDSNYSGTPVGTPDVKVYANNIEVSVSEINGALGKITLVAVSPTGTPMTADYDWSRIEDNLLEAYLTEAHDLINAKLGERYVLPLSEVPSLIVLIEKKLTAGLLLDKEYSVGGDESEDTRGRRWIKWAEAKLEELVDGSLELRDSSGTVLAQKSGEGFEGFPDEDTKDLSEDDSGGAIKFRISKQF